MTAESFFLWFRIVLIAGLVIWLARNIWKRRALTDFTIRRFTRRGSRRVRTVRHEGEREILDKGLSKTQRLRLGQAETIARKRERERLEEEKARLAQRKKAKAASSEHAVQMMAERQADRFDFEIDEELSREPTSEVLSDVTDAAARSHPVSTPPTDADDEVSNSAISWADRRAQARPWAVDDYTPDLSELGPQRRNTLGPPPVAPGQRSVMLRLRNLDEDRLEVVANGRPVAELNQEKELEVLAPAGPLILEVMQISGDGYCRARLDTGDAKRITVCIANSQLTSCMADGGLWPMDIEARKSARSRAQVGGPDSAPAGDRPVPPWEKTGWDVSTGWDLSQGVERVSLRIRSKDGEWADLYVNGSLLARIRGHEELEAFVPQGNHLLEVREYLADAPYCRAELITGDTPEILLDIQQDTPIRSFNHQGFRLLER